MTGQNTTPSSDLPALTYCSAYGDSMPAEIETKRLNMQTGSQDASKGHSRTEKAKKQKTK